MIETRSLLVRPPASGPRATLGSAAPADFAVPGSAAVLVLAGPGPWPLDRRRPRDLRG